MVCRLRLLRRECSAGRGRMGMMERRRCISPGLSLGYIQNRSLNFDRNIKHKHNGIRTETLET